MSAALKTLLQRLAAGWQHLVHGTALPNTVQSARAGLLNTGELVVFLPGSGMLVLSEETTDIVRDVLDADPEALRFAFPVGGVAP